MKNCPFCAEQVQDAAVKCKHCHSSLKEAHKAIQSPTGVTTEPDASKKSSIWMNPKELLWDTKPIRYFILAFYFMMLLGMSTEYPFWGLLITLGSIWFLPNDKEKLDIRKRLKSWREHKWRVAFSGLMVFMVVFGALGTAAEEKEQQMIAEYPAPTFEILSPAGYQGSDMLYDLRFKVNDATEVMVYNDIVQPNEEGIYETQVDLNRMTTKIRIEARNEHKEADTSFTVTRDETEEERLAREEKEARAAEEARLAEIEAEAERARAIAEQRAWEQSKAGRICSSHPEWTKSTCDRLADGEVWIGMTYDMLVAHRGEPRTKNQSNYGSGNQWQWCWNYNYDPNCFYDRNDDGIVDSYN